MSEVVGKEKNRDVLLADHMPETIRIGNVVYRIDRPRVSRRNVDPVDSVESCSAEVADSLGKLVVLCPTCHRRVDVERLSSKQLKPVGERAGQKVKNGGMYSDNCENCGNGLQLYELDSRKHVRVMRCQKCGMWHVYKRDVLGKWKLLKAQKST